LRLKANTFPRIADWAMAPSLHFTLKEAGMAYPSASFTHDLDPVIVNKVEFYCRQLRNALHPSRETLDDYRQDLYCAALLGSGKFDPTRSQWATFVEHVVAHRAIDIIRCHRLQKHHEVLITDLMEEGYSDDSPLFGISDLEGQPRLGTSDGTLQDIPHDVTEHRDLTLDVAIAMSTMSPFLRRIAQCLLDGLRVADMTRIFQMPYTSLHYHVQQVRAIFAAHHLDLYVQGFRNLSRPRRKKSK